MVEITIIPASTFLVVATAIGLALMSNIVTKVLVDIKKERRINAEVSAFNKELRQAVMGKDKAKEGKLRKREKSMRELQLKTSMGRMKVMFITWIPFIGVWYGLSALLGGFGTAVAVMPFEVHTFEMTNLTIGPEGGPIVPYLGLFWWYFVSSLSFGSILAKALGTTMN
ncbi:MAG: EMC3/TMCO1 family protein [Nitrososphaerales archaeon]